jgi:N-acetylglucosamine kinase-like BadF-type ATPase
MGDAGSGYWLGRAALDAVMRAHDGRGPATALTEVVS